MTTTGTDAGWYPDPERGRLRYFDGEKWGPYAPEDSTTPTGAADPASPPSVPAATPNESQAHSTAGSLPIRERPRATELTHTGLFFGGKPSAFLRVAYALVAVGALVYGIWSFVAYHTNLGPGAWYTVLNYTVAILLGLVAVAQAAAPVRFLWPGWLFIALAVLSFTWTSLMIGIAQLSIFGINRLFWIDYFFAFIMTIGMALALVAWHLEVAAGVRPADYVPDNGVTSPHSEPARAKTRSR